MKRKTTNDKKKTAWQLAWEAKQYPAKMPVVKALKLSRADVVFVLMLWMGMSKVDAYLTAYPTKASRNSVAAMATRKSQEKWVQDYLDALYDGCVDDKLKFNIIV